MRGQQELCHLVPQRSLKGRAAKRHGAMPGQPLPSAGQSAQNFRWHATGKVAELAVSNAASHCDCAARCVMADSPLLDSNTS